MDFHVVNIVFQIIVFLFAISVHESAHAWMADKCGDPTAKMLGRITMNPIKHIDPIGTVLLPAIGLFTGAGIFGWAKPCPVTPQNFRDPIKGDILTTVAGPVSNFLLVAISVLGLALISIATPTGKELVQNIAQRTITDTSSLLMPVVWLLYSAVQLNVLLGIFNLLPVPPLDGSHIFRHMLPDSIRNAYDSIGIVGIILIFTFGGRIIWPLVNPVVNYVDSILLRL
jgi:Zn-dependent protease